MAIEGINYKELAPEAWVSAVSGYVHGLVNLNRERLPDWLEAVRNREIVVSFICGDSRTAKAVGSAFREDFAPLVWPFKSVASYPKISAMELVGVAGKSKFIEVASHHDPKGETGENCVNDSCKSICGGEQAKFDYYNDKKSLVTKNC